MAKALDEQLVDRRTVERNIQKGLLSRKDHEAYLKGLSDAEGNAEVVDLEEDQDADAAGHADAEADALAEV